MNKETTIKRSAKGSIGDVTIYNAVQSIKTSHHDFSSSRSYVEEE